MWLAVVGEGPRCRCQVGYSTDRQLRKGDQESAQALSQSQTRQYVAMTLR